MIHVRTKHKIHLNTCIPQFHMLEYSNIVLICKYVILLFVCLNVVVQVGT